MKGGREKGVESHWADDNAGANIGGCFPLIREGGGRFLGPVRAPGDYELAVESRGRRASPNFSQTRGNNGARTRAQRGLRGTGKVARPLERSFLLLAARNTALSHLSQDIPVIWIPDQRQREGTANRETIRRFDDRFLGRLEDLLRFPNETKR